ncbi:MAG: CheR family methyltransferase [Pseudomonadota bacterium]|jgi:chemotaxis protein methyltransferase CheR
MLSEQQFTKLSDLLKDETAVVLGNGKEYLVESRLSSLMREEGFNTLSDMIDTVLRRSNPALNQKVLLALTTNETSFFRDLAPFELLRTKLLPPILAARAQSRSLTVWSAACSTGQEPYSIAIMLRDSFPELESWKVSILASDLNPQVVEKGRRGVYSSIEVNRGLPAELLVKYFTQKGDLFSISDQVRSMVTFFEQNLISNWSVPQVDLLFMRNVLIYFDTETKKALFEKIKEVLAPDGYLFLGTAESPYRIVEGFARVEGAGNIYKLVGTGSK